MSSSSITYFSRAHNSRIGNLHNTINAEIVNQYGATSGSGKPPLERLLDRVCKAAVHNSAERGHGDTPKCHPDTRVAVQEEIMSWIRHGFLRHDPTFQKIMWLSGPAGSGKTAIAGTLAEECAKLGEGLLAASYFFSGFSQSVDRRLKAPFIATLVYQLLQLEAIGSLREVILSVIETDPTVLDRHLDEQVDQLILGPLHKIAEEADEQDEQLDRTLWPKVIIIDGIDECDVQPERKFGTEDERLKAKEDEHREVLSALARASADPAFPFLIIVASRPEPAIRNFFNNPSIHVKQVFLDDKYTPEADIETYARAVLTKIGREYSLRSDWFAEDVPRMLALRASGQFVYVTTAIRFVQDRTRPPHEQLERVMKWSEFSEGTGNNVFAPLDALYTGILKTSPNPRLAAIWISALSALPDPASVSSYPEHYKSAFLESFPGESQWLLGSISSLIGVNSRKNHSSNSSSSSDRSTSPFTLYHQTILDFLHNRSRSGDLHVSDADVAKFNQDRHYHILKNRGPARGALSDEDLPGFLDHFCFQLESTINPSRNLRYDPTDVNWWWYHMDPEDRADSVPGIFVKVHRDCRWYFCCLPTCRVWRKKLLQHCKADSWPRVPTRMELLRDRFTKYTDTEDNRFPLRASEGTGTSDNPGESDGLLDGEVDGPNMPVSNAGSSDWSTEESSDGGNESFDSSGPILPRLAIRGPPTVAEIERQLGLR